MCKRDTVDACDSRIGLLYLSSGFVPIPEDDLPIKILEWFNFAPGNMQGSDVCLMKRMPFKKTTG
jgi:hypothetical protein